MQADAANNYWSAHVSASLNITDLLNLPADWFYEELAAWPSVSDVPAGRALVAEIAWAARARNIASPEVTPGDHVSAYWFRAFRLRYDFRFKSLHELLAGVPELVASDALLACCYAFSLAGDPRAEAHDIIAAVSEALSRPDADAMCRLVAGHAFWLRNEPECALMLLDLCAATEDLDSIDPNVEYRRASALRKLRRYEEALDAIHAAIELLGEESHEIHQDYARERELILASSQLDALASGGSDALVPNDLVRQWPHIVSSNVAQFLTYGGPVSASTSYDSPSPSGR